MIVERKSTLAENTFPKISAATADTAQIYQIHHHAADTGITDLAAQHDGQNRDDHHFEQAGFEKLLK